MWNCGRHATNMNVGAVIVCRSRAPSAAIFTPSPRLNLSLNVITARVARSSNPLIGILELSPQCDMFLVALRDDRLRHV